MNQQLDLDSPYIYCGICFKDNTELSISSNNKLVLTSCAHITCDSHIQSTNSFLEDDDNNKSIVCPVCHTPDISTVLINTSLSDELKNFFIPTPQKIDLLTSSGKFQYCALVDRINNYKTTIGKLNEKVKKQNKFLHAAKEEISYLNQYKSKVDELNSEIESLKRQLCDSKRPETFDLSNEELGYSVEISPPPVQQQNRYNTVSHSFIEKVHQQSSKKVIPGSQSSNSLESRVSSDRNKKQSFFAESTKIGDLHSNSISPNTSSAGSPSNSLKRFGYVNKMSSSSTTTKKNRPSTSQLASRITANMKFGAPVSSKNVVTGNYRPSSTVTRVSKSPTLTRSNRRFSEASPYFGK
ncbi:CST9 Chromosome stability protein 9 [Candida maltosa Xu316]